MTSLNLTSHLLKTVGLSLLLGANTLPTHAQTPPRPPRSLPAVEETTPIQQKLKLIILPSVEFHETTVADALEFLRQECRRLDPDPDPQARGVNFLLKLPASPQPTTIANSAAANPADAVPTAHTRITLTLHRIPLGEALNYIAREVGMKVKVEPYAVSLVPLTENTDQLITATFRVSPNFIANQTTTGGSPNALDKSATSAP